jgi:hypothetical protein
MFGLLVTGEIYFYPVLHYTAQVDCYDPGSRAQVHAAAAFYCALGPLCRAKRTSGENGYTILSLPLEMRAPRWIE